MAARKRLGEMLLEAGVIDETQLQSALGHQRKWGGRLGQALIDLKLATEPQVVSALSKKFGYEVVSVSDLQPSPALEGALKLVPRELALRQTLLPLAADTSSLSIAMADPSNIAMIDELSFRTGRRVKVALAGDREIAGAIRRLYFAEEDRSRTPIPFDDAGHEQPLETTRDPFAAMPDDVREEYFNRPARTLEQPGAKQGGAPARPMIQPVPVPPRVVPAPAPAPADRSDAAALSADRPTIRLEPEAPLISRMVPELEDASRPAAAPQPAASPPPQPAQQAPPPPPAQPGAPTLQAPASPPAYAAAPPPAAPSPLMGALDRLARGEKGAPERAARLVAALVRVLVERDIVSEEEILAALTRSRR